MQSRAGAIRNTQDVATGLGSRFRHTTLLKIGPQARFLSRKDTRTTAPRVECPVTSDSKDSPPPSFDDLHKEFETSGLLPETLPLPEKTSSTGGSRHKNLIVALLAGAVGVGASFMSCIGQSFHLRQAQALEGIEQQLKEIRAACPANALVPPLNIPHPPQRSSEPRETHVERVPVTRSARKKTRMPRVRLTHLEVRCGKSLRLRIAIADEVLAEVGDELGDLIKKTAPRTQPDAVPTASANFIITRAHADEADGYQAHAADDVHYHEKVREQLVEIIRALCDTSLSEALKIAKEEYGRRAESVN